MFLRRHGEEDRKKQTEENDSRDMREGLDQGPRKKRERKNHSPETSVVYRLAPVQPTTYTRLRCMYT